MSRKKDIGIIINLYPLPTDPDPVWSQFSALKTEVQHLSARHIMELKVMLAIIYAYAREMIEGGMCPTAGEVGCAFKPQLERCPKSVRRIFQTCWFGS